MWYIHSLNYNVYLFTEAEYCIYPGCVDEKEFYGAQFCCEDHLDQASDEGTLAGCIDILFNYGYTPPPLIYINFMIVCSKSSHWLIGI